MFRSAFVSSLSGPIVGAFAIAALMISSAAAQQQQQQQQQQPVAQRASAQDVRQFLDNPKQLLDMKPPCGPGLTSRTASLALADRAALPAIIALLPNGSPCQRASIGAGLARAAQAAVSTDQDYAAQIQQAVASSGNEQAVAAFSAVAGNSQTAATGGGGGGGGGGGAGGPTSAGGLPSGGGGGGGSSGSDTQFAGTPNASQSNLTGGSVGVGSGGSVSPR